MDKARKLKKRIRKLEAALGMVLAIGERRNKDAMQRLARARNTMPQPYIRRLPRIWRVLLWFL